VKRGELIPRHLLILVTRNVLQRTIQTWLFTAQISALGIAGMALNGRLTLPRFIN
jgi:hypothetical protein